ncbi:MAG TPA: tetratricopeptide repeat protein [Chloroflexota bacterium]|nr:tetratricopeptide repeat protein [Chloroflexota bacterium]
MVAPGRFGDSGWAGLPAQPTLLVGRTREILLARQLLLRDDARLVTLTGAAGIGKTRLGIAVAGRLPEAFPDGVCFVDLAPITDPALVASTMAHRLGLTDLTAQSSREGMQRALRDKRALLVLDNFEQVVPAAPVLAELLEACSGLKILVTSRTPLGLRWEHELPVPPLPLPDLKHLPPLDVLGQVPPVALFTSRARAADPEFRLTLENVRAVAELCTRLDGLPLAIELAAARSKLLPPEALLARLGRRLDFLKARAQDQPTRHRTLRGAIDGSYDALPGPLQKMFRRLAVFVGSLTIEAVEDVVAATMPDEIDVLDGLSALVDQSLLLREDGAEGSSGREPYFRMLETIREYALERLIAAGEADAARRSHALYFRALVERAYAEVTGPDQVAWLDRLERKNDNIRAALAWAIEQKDGETGLRIAGTLWRFWWVRGYMGEGRRWLEALLSLGGDVTPRVRANALTIAGNVAWDTSEFERARACWLEAIVLWQACGDEGGVARCLNGLGNVHRDLGEIDQAIARHEESLALRRKIGDTIGVAMSLNNLGNAVRDQGDYARAASLYEQSLALRRELGDRQWIAQSLNDLGRVERLQGDYARALLHQQESIRLFQQLGDNRGLAMASGEVASLARDQGDPATAIARAAESARQFREAGLEWGVAYALLVLGHAAALQRRYELAAWVLGAAESLFESLRLPVPVVERDQHQRYRRLIRDQLGEEAFAAAWSAGRAVEPPHSLEALLEAVTDSSSEAAVLAADLTATGPALDLLTPREREVVALLARGRTNRQIADALVITEGTARLHVAHILGKLGFHARTQIVAWAVKNGFAEE